MTFEQLGLIKPILQSLSAEGYENPTPIQEKSIPTLLKGTDLLGCAQTGTGKTAAFALPILQQLQADPIDFKNRKIKALIVTPTRELAIQIDESFKIYGKHLPLKSTVIFGGVNQTKQVEILKKGVDILVATPGRLLDLHQQGFISLRDLKVFVLDEADRMLDMGFIHDVKKLLKIIPEKRQSLFFSATMPPPIQELAKTILRNPVMVEVTPVSSTAETIQQKLYFCETAEKKDLLVDLIHDNRMKSVLVFTRTKHGADKVVKWLVKNQISSMAIHGNKSQNARQNALNAFKKGEITALVATDIAARGIDIDELKWVINFEIPNIPETYVHRIGRSGRAGNEGTAFSICDPTERTYIRDIEKIIKKQIPRGN